MEQGATMQAGSNDSSDNWINDADHRAFLAADAHRSLNFFDASIRPGGGFQGLDPTGRPLASAVQELHSTTRLVHSYALARMAGRPDSAGIIDQGMQFLWNGHRDMDHGGYLWSVDGTGAVDGTKLAYGHVFVLLAASSAKMSGHPDADRLLADISEVLDSRYWDRNAGLFRDEFTRDWQPFSNYRGMNANMHGTEALLAAYEATGDSTFLTRAGGILQFFIAGQAAANGWRLPEHYDQNWQPDHSYSGNPMFRPAGTTPGHSFEMARLLLQWWDLAGRPQGDTPAQALALVETGLADAWNDGLGGIAYTLHRDGSVDSPARYWWPVTEALGALAALIKLDPTPALEGWYRKIWGFATRHLVDAKHGGWHHEVGPDNLPAMTQFQGKPDIYHALQADLLPLAGGLSGQAQELGRTKPLS
jgi:mannose/cellobiose epimerase-like protein (N-acyl-D-glucosamine 2-epimerase family)